MMTTTTTTKPVTIEIHCCVGDNSIEWVVSDDGGEFDDEVFDSSDSDESQAEAAARNDAACRAVHYQQQGRQWSQEEV